MLRKTKTVIFGALLAFLSTAALSSYAGNSTEKADAIHHAKISLVQAINTAETYAKGKAISAELDHHLNTWDYEVKVISGIKKYEIKVNIDTGKVISSREDSHDGPEIFN